MNYKNHISKSFENLLKHIGALGSCEFFLIVIIFFVLIGEIKISLILWIGFILMYLIAIPLRIIFFKPRPNPKKYSNIIEKIKVSSFPSMHSARSSFLGVVLIYYMNYAIGISIFIVSLILIIMYSRIYNKKHYYTDLIGGFAIAVVVWVAIYSLLYII